MTDNQLFQLFSFKCFMWYLEIHESSGDLIAGTHCKGIYKISFSPLRHFVNQQFSTDKDFLFVTKENQLPWFQSASNYPDFRSFKKKDIVFWLNEMKPIKKSVQSIYKVSKVLINTGGIWS